MVMFTFSTVITYAQERCGTAIKHKQQQQKNLIDSDEQFNQWLESKIATQKQSNEAREKDEPYKIPVVVHIIHNGEAIGSGANISNEQILSQIKVLNEDFRRMNADASGTPEEFLPVAGSLDIEFILAKRDPEGIATNGIVRVNGQRAGWSSHDNVDLKAVSYWPAEDYMNIWVCNFTDYIGLAQFPVSDLPGLENSPNNRLTDGVIIHYKSFGSINDGNFDLDAGYDRGRTTTHEAGHFFGLKHIWGDEGQCSGSDYVDDTPNQGGATSGCPGHPKTTCQTVDMFQNFLDYTNDECMNLFTVGQVDRMRVVIENSPRRKSLLTSAALNEADPVANDLGIRDVTSPSESECSVEITPTIDIRNYGNNAVTSALVRLTFQNMVVETKEIPMNLAPLQQMSVSFSAMTLDVGDNTLVFELLETNGTTDSDDVGNMNTLMMNAYVPFQISAPFSEDFDDIPPGWRIVNSDEEVTWKIHTAPHYRKTNTALGLDFFNYENGIGEHDIIYTPAFNLSTLSDPVLYFDRSHARFGFSHDRLNIIVVRNCESIAEGSVIYSKGGPDLATASQRTSYYMPSTGDWTRETIDLSEFAGEESIQLAFVGINDYGNNLYLDNVTVTEADFSDIAVSRILNPSRFTCEDNAEMQVEINNFSVKPVNDLEIVVSVNGLPCCSETFTNLNLTGLTTLSVKDVKLNAGENDVDVQVNVLDNVTYDDPSNNALSARIRVDSDRDIIPLRLTFEDLVHEKWLSLNSEGNATWEITEVDGGHAVAMKSFENVNIGEENWFVSPLLDFSHAEENATLLFDFSHKSRDYKVEELKIFVSRNCGNSYESVPYDWQTPESLDEAWIPTSEDWTRRVAVDLSDYAGEAAVRLAFVVTNMNGNNLYLDNIEIFNRATPTELPFQMPYNIFGYDRLNPAATSLKIGFKLADRSDVLCQVVDVNGKVIGYAEWHEVLNQVYPLPLDAATPQGIYFVRVKVASDIYVTKIAVNR